MSRSSSTSPESQPAPRAERPVRGGSGAPKLPPDTRIPEDLHPFIRKFSWPKDDARYLYRVTEHEDVPLVNALFNKVFRQDRPPEHYLWKAWGSPAGPPFTAHAVSRETGKAVAIMTGVRRRFWVEGQRADAIMICETCSDPDERRGGLIYQKMFKGGAARACDTSDVWWCYGGQSTEEAMQVGNRWFGYQYLFALEPLELRLSLAPALGARLGAPGRALGVLLQKLRRPFLGKRRHGYALRETQSFGPEFDRMWEQHRDLYRVVHYRDAAELQWRYADCPTWQHRVLVAYRDGQPCGYVIWREWEPDPGVKVATVMDLWDGKDVDLAEALLDGVRHEAMRSGCVFLRFFVMPDGSGQQAMRRFSGCRVSPYEEPDRVLAGPSQGSDPEAIPEAAFDVFRAVLFPDGWYYTQGDCDLRD